MSTLVEQLKEKTNGLSNLQEKDAEQYIDVLYIDIPVLDDTLVEIAKYYAREIVKINFDDFEDDGYHEFLYAPDKYVKPLGIDKLCVCPYKGQIHSEMLFSNYMWQCFEDSDILFIDLYDCQYDVEEDIYDAVLTELYNFQRDAQLVIDGKYEDELEFMKAVKEDVKKYAGYFEL